MSYTCPCCGWDNLDQKPYKRWPDRLPVDAMPPYEDSFGAASYEVCRCCGFEFGNDDNPGTATPESFESYRASWMRSGARWFSESLRPSSWSLDDQLGRAGIDPPRLELPRANLITAESLVETLRSACPEFAPTIDEHLDYNDGLLTHVLLADLRRFAERAHETEASELSRRCLEVVTETFERGTDYLRNAVAVSFVEGCDERTDFVRTWPTALRDEAHRQRTWRP